MALPILCKMRSLNAGDEFGMERAGELSLARTETTIAVLLALPWADVCLSPSAQEQRRR